MSYVSLDMRSNFQIQPQLNIVPIGKILVLAIVRNDRNCDYDELEDLASHHTLIRQFLNLPEEKVFSLFEPLTQWISKGKATIYWEYQLMASRFTSGAQSLFTVCGMKGIRVRFT